MKMRQIIMILLVCAAMSCLFLACSVVVTVSFETNGGSVVENQYLSGGSYVTRPDDPVKTGHTFIDWFADKELTIPFDFDSTRINKNTTIYAGFSTNEYTITFVSEGTAVESITQPYGSALEIFESYRTGYVFDGWFKDSAAITRFTAETMPDCNLTLYAGWVQDKGYSAFTFDKNPYGYTLTAVRDIKLNLLSVPETFNNQPVTRVGKAAFAQARQMTRIEIPDSVEFLEESAFEGCSALSSVRLPKLETISPRMFYGCANLISVVLFDGTKTIGKDAFFGCLSLDVLGVPQSIHTIEDRAFAESGLVAFSVPASVTTLSPDLFYGCASLTEVTLATGLLEIGSGVFEKCTALKKIKVPEGVTTIGCRAFAMCSALTDISLPQSLTATGDYLFFDCVSLAKIVLPPLLRTAGDYTFLKCVSLKKVTLPTVLTTIGHGFFDGCSQLDDITLPQELLHIGNSAFLGCSNLKAVLLPPTLLDIGSMAFYGCDSLSAIDTQKGAEDSLRRVGGQAFYGTAWLSAITPALDVYIGRVLYRAGTGFDGFLPNTLSVAGLAFAGRKNIASVTITPQIEIIGDSAFENSGLESLDLPSSVLEIGEKAFKNCKSLQSVTAQNGLETIGEDAFAGCVRLEEIDIPKTTRHIGDGAFSGCVLLTRVGLPTGGAFVAVSDNLFSGCTSLREISIPNNVSTVGSKAFFGCTSLTTVDLGQGVTTVEISAFEGCESLEGIDFPPSLTQVMAYAFRGTGLKRIKLGKELSVIGEQAFTTLFTQTSLYGGDPAVKNNFQPFGIIVEIESSPQISHSFDMGVHTRIILPDDLYSQIQQEKFAKVAHEGWRKYKPYVCGKSMRAGDFLIDGDRLVAYLGDSTDTGSSAAGKRIDIPTGIVTIAPYAFYGSLLNGEINLPHTVTTIGAKAFYGCKNVTALDLGNGLVTVGQSAFAGMASLVEIRIAPTVTVIGARAFDGCDLLVNIYCGVLETRRPSGWDNAWLGDCKARVLWGQSLT